MQLSKFIDVDGISTRYFCEGSGAPIVLMHGGTFGRPYYYNAYHWSLNFDALSKRFRVYAFDRLGQGHTDNPPKASDYTLNNVIRHSERVLELLEIGPCILVGHSRGALVAARIASERPDLVRGLILVDSNSLAPTSPSTPTDFYGPLEKDVPSSPDEEFVMREPIANSVSTDHITPDFVQEMVRISNLPKTLEAQRIMGDRQRELFASESAKIRHDTLRKLIETSHMPIRILWGAADPSAPVECGIELLRMLGDSPGVVDMQVFDRSGHYVFRERFSDVNDSIARFAERLPRTVTSS